MFEIHHSSRQGLPWQTGHGVSTKGYTFSAQNDLFNEQRLPAYFDHTAEEKEFVDKLKASNGHFCVIIDTGDKIMAAVDKARSIPLFYTCNPNAFFLSDDAYWIQEKTGGSIDDVQKHILMLTANTYGPNTLNPDIKQLQAGAYLVYDKAAQHLKIGNYYGFWQHDYFDVEEDVLFNMFDDVLINSFERLVRSAEDRWIVIPLSGGQDSRLVACMLKRLGHEKVRCFSYGSSPDEDDPATSKKVAETLGYEWRFVEYDQHWMGEVVSSAELRRFWSYACNLVAVPHVQDFPAVMHLTRDGFAPEGSLFVPGHTGDVIAGSNLRPLFALDMNWSNDFLVQEMANRLAENYIQQRQWMEQLRAMIAEDLRLVTIDTRAQTVNYFDYINYRERQTKFILNSLRVYEMFHCAWRLPLWDDEYMAFWQRMPVAFKWGKGFYTRYLQSMLFKTFGVDYEGVPTYESCKAGLHNLIDRRRPRSRLRTRVGRMLASYMHHRNSYHAHYYKWPLRALLKGSANNNGLKLYYFFKYMIQPS